MRVFRSSVLNSVDSLMAYIDSLPSPMVHQFFNVYGHPQILRVLGSSHRWWGAHLADDPCVIIGICSDISRILDKFLDGGIRFQYSGWGGEGQRFTTEEIRFEFTYLGDFDGYFSPMPREEAISPPRNRYLS